MLNSRFRKAFAGFAVSLAAAFGSVGSAQAAVYHGVFDPDFGGALTGLDWSGSILFSVPDSCLASAGANAIIGCPGATLDSATVAFAGLGNETLDFSADLAGAILGITFDSNSQVSGINTSFIGAVLSTTLPTNEFFNLLFNGSSVLLSYMPGANDSPACFLFSSGCGSSTTVPGHGMTVTLVPEPSTYALLLAGLGVVVFVTGRRRR
jgi:hypothetical protein